MKSKLPLSLSLSFWPIRLKHCCSIPHQQHRPSFQKFLNTNSISLLPPLPRPRTLWKLRIADTLSAHHQKLIVSFWFWYFLISIRSACSSHSVTSICQTRPKWLKILRRQCCLLISRGKRGNWQIAVHIGQMWNIPKSHKNKNEICSLMR